MADCLHDIDQRIQTVGKEILAGGGQNNIDVDYKILMVHEH